MVAATRTDPRRFYTHQAVHRTLGGKALETGPSGIGKRLGAVLKGSITLDVLMTGTDAINLGDLTEGMVITGLKSIGGATQGTVTFALPDYTGGAATLISGATVAAGAKSLTGGTFAALDKDQQLTATPASGAAGEVSRWLLDVEMVDNGWF